MLNGSFRSRPSDAPPVRGFGRADLGAPALRRQVAAIVLLAIVYALSARAGQTLAIAPGNITAVFPPSGIALAALLALGWRVWPGVWLGAFAASAWVLHPAADLLVATTTTAAIATGATLQALAGALLIQRYTQPPQPFQVAEDVFKFVGLAAVSGIVSPSLGAMSLLAAGFIGPPALASVWTTWWLGDVVGMILFTPLLLTPSAAVLQNFSARRAAEAAALVALLAATAHFVLGVPLPGTAAYDFPLPYPLIPFVIWAALRFGPFGVALTVLLIAITAVWGTAAGLGPFLGETRNASLLYTQAFIAVIAVSGLGLAAAIHQRERAEQRARDARDALQEMLERITEGFYAVDTDWRFTYLNSVAERYFGRSRDSLLGRRLWDAFPVAVGSIFEERYRQAMATGTPQRFELRSPLTRRWIEVHAYPSAEGLSVYFHDIEERKQAREALERTAQELERSNRDLEEFASVISHDLQEPLRGISGCVQLLASREEVQRDPKGREYIRHVLMAEERMEAMIRDLLAFSRLHGSRESLERVDLGAVVAEARANLRAAAEESAAEIEVGTLPQVLGDHHQLVRLFQNLLGNAIKFRRPDRPPRIAVDAQRDDGRWVVTVRDNGIGIGEGGRERIFQLFQRLHPRGAYEGTGLGLAICRRIVELHGGEIHVEAEGGAGSTFVITFPAEREP